MTELPDKIIPMDQLKIFRGMGKFCKCENRSFTIDIDNRRVTCDDCGAVVDPYDALCEIASQDEKRNELLERFLRQKRELAQYKPHLRVIKSLESHYRQKNKMLPICPRCSEPFYLEELTGWLCKALADKRIKAFKESEGEE